jgi:hypothetical protein
MQGSRFLGQYSPGAPGWVARPAELPNSDLTAAFEPGTGTVTPPPTTPTPAPATPETATPTPTPTSTPVAGPSTSIQVDDDLIDPGQSIRVTLIGRSTVPLAWIQYVTVLGEDSPDEDHSPATDPELARRDFDCAAVSDLTECANVWTIAPTVPGRYTLWGRTAERSGVLSEWTPIKLRIRDIGPTATPTSTSTPTATPTQTAIPNDITPTQTPIPNDVTPTPTLTATPSVPQEAPMSNDITPTPTATSTATRTL